ncbi:MAG: PepSY domain-containing protein [Halioglobus sp.]|nr:PepSY domain-containing protein [Halioglobus sp.]
MRRRPRLVGILWHWHRRVGLVVALFALLLAVTGIVLNHTSQLGLDRSFVPWSWLTQLYGDDSSDLPAFKLGEKWLTRASGGHVYLDAQEVAPCSGRLVGAVAADDLLYAGCAEELLLLTREGALVESVSASTGLPAPLQAIGLIDEQLVLQSGGSWWLADLDVMDFSQRAPAGGAVIRQLVPDRLPESIRARIPAPSQWLSWERVLLDLHSGRLFGRFGVLWMDMMGVLLATLATSGVAMWWLHRRRKK